MRKTDATFPSLILGLIFISILLIISGMIVLEREVVVVGLVVLGLSYALIQLDFGSLRGFVAYFRYSFSRKLPCCICRKTKPQVKHWCWYDGYAGFRYFSYHDTCVDSALAEPEKHSRKLDLAIYIDDQRKSRRVS